MGGPEEKDENGKKACFFRLRKVRGKFRRRKACAGGAGAGGGGCLKVPRTPDSGGESQTSDPNSPNFSSEMLRILIEKNDFYSKESNPHLDNKHAAPSCPHRISE
nr:uncharacterized protein LOC104109530 [Ipomoea trifida]